MSLKTLSLIAAERDHTTPKKTKRPAKADEAGETELRTYTDMLVAAIPTEVLGLYTFVTGYIVAEVTFKDKLLGLRWAIYAGGFLLIAGYLVGRYRTQAGRKRKFPLLELLTAWFAFGAWGLVMPGSPLMAELSKSNQRIWTVLITAIGVGLLMTLGNPLKKKAT